MDSLNKISKEILEKLYLLIMKLLLELHFRFIAQIITYYSYLNPLKLHNCIFSQF